MFQVYDPTGVFVGHALSIRGASAMSMESPSTVRLKVNRPQHGRWNYYTDNARGQAIRLAYELNEIVMSTPEPTATQIEAINKAIRELLS